jgi:hypothetical protein
MSLDLASTVASQRSSDAWKGGAASRDGTGPQQWMPRSAGVAEAHGLLIAGLADEPLASPIISPHTHGAAASLAVRPAAR